MNQLYIGWKRVFKVAVIASLSLLGIDAALSSVVWGGSAWETSWTVAAVFYGRIVLRWPPVFDFCTLMAAFVAIYPTALGFVLALSLVLRAERRLKSLATAAFVGICWYVATLYGLSMIFPWLSSERNWITAASYLGSSILAAWLLSARETGKWTSPLQEPQPNR